jgi:hypothetical protein
MYKSKGWFVGCHNLCVNGEMFLLVECCFSELASSKFFKHVGLVPNRHCHHLFKAMRTPKKWQNSQPVDGGH